MAATNTHPDVQVHLPVHDPASALVLSRELLAAADLKKLPTFLATARERMRAANAALARAVGSRGHAKAPSTLHELDTEIDQACAAVSAILIAWAALPATEFPQTSAARALEGALFPDGLRSLVQSDAAMEAEMLTARLARVRRSPELRHDLQSTGVEPLAAYLEARVGPYGEAARAARAEHGASSSPDLRTPYLALVDAMRAYVTRVNAQVEPGNANSARRAKRLLAPLRNARRATHGATHHAKSAAPTTSPAGGAPSGSGTGAT